MSPGRSWNSCALLGDCETMYCRGWGMVQKLPQKNFENWGDGSVSKWGEGSIWIQSPEPKGKAWHGGVSVYPVADMARQEESLMLRSRQPSLPVSTRTMGAPVSEKQ